MIALECASEEDSVEVRKVIQDRWDEFEDAYGGSCAPYITLRALQEVLDRFGFRSQVRLESRSPDDLTGGAGRPVVMSLEQARKILESTENAAGERGLAHARAGGCVRVLTPDRRRQEGLVGTGSQLGNSATRLCHTGGQKPAQG